MKVAVLALTLLSVQNAAGSHHKHHKHVRGSSDHQHRHHHEYDNNDFVRMLKGGGCHQCDCFTCDEVKPLSNGMVEIKVGHCKDEAISWMCCVGVDGGKKNCDTIGGGEKCEGFKCNTVAKALTIQVPADSTYFTINTHDGQTQGDGHNQHDVCGGTGDQGGGCAKGDYTAHCEIDFDLEEDCNYEPPDDTPAPSPFVGTPSPSDPDVDTPAPSPFAGTPSPSDPDVDTPAPSPSGTDVDTPAPSPYGGTPSPSDSDVDTPAPSHSGTDIDTPAPSYVGTPSPSVVDVDTPSPTREPNPPTFITGDPHIKTFSGETYDFHGGCDLVLLHNPSFNNGQGLEIHVRTKITRWWSSIESAAVRIGDDVLEIKAGIQDRPYWINGKENKFLTSRNFPFTVGGFSGRYRYLNDMAIQYRIALPDDQAILIKSVKNMLRVELDGAEEQYFGKSLGLMGSFDGKFLGRDGVTEYNDKNEFGQAWQVGDTDPRLFHALEGPQYPERCAMPELDGTSVSRRLGAGNVSRRAAEKACARVAKDEFDNCVSDVLGMDDVAAAEAF